MSNTYRSSLNNEFYELVPVTIGEVRQELERRAPVPGTRILRDFLDSGQAIMRFRVEVREELSYFYNMVLNSLNAEKLNDKVWVRKTMFSPENGYSFLLINLMVAGPETLEYYRKWRDVSSSSSNRS